MSPTFVNAFIDLTYLVAAALFIFGLKKLSSPRTARSGNLLAAVGMLIAVVVTLLHRDIVSFPLIIVGVIVGSAVGLVLARFVQMTQMPQLVGLFNGFGGIASVLVACGEFFGKYYFADNVPLPMNTSITIVLSVLIGMVTFTGSVVAGGKLHGLVTGNPVLLPLRHVLNLLLGLAVIGLGALVVTQPDQAWPLMVIVLIAGALGVLLTIPIGGADMPVVISLLNAYSGLAAAATGFVLNNRALIVSGALVGASGIILTKIMCQAMNRSLFNVLFGGFGQADLLAPGAVAGATTQGTVRSCSAEEAAMILETATQVIIVPGYGLAVAQAQHVVRDLADLLHAKHDITVKYAIHPVAGRMPGHMNVLLAEANVPYDQLYDLEINSEFANTDVALVIGANDVTNPAARHDKSSPIYGMPILDVDKARTVMVCKRSLNPGFAGVDNELYTMDRTLMLFGDAKKMMTELVAELKAN